MSKYILFFIMPLILLASQPLHADTIDKIKFLKVSEQEGKAVVKDANGKLQMVGVGDVIEEGGSRVTSKERVASEGKQVAGSGLRVDESKKRVADKEKKVASSGLRVIEIAKDRVVLERKTEAGPEKIIIRLEKGKQKVEIVSKERPRQQTLPVQAIQPGAKSDLHK